MDFRPEHRSQFPFLRVPSGIDDTDIGQAIVRICICSAALILMMFQENVIDPSRFTSTDSKIFFYLLAVYGIFSTILTIVTLKFFPKNLRVQTVRRLFGVVMDLGAAGLGLHLTRDYSLIMFPVLLTIIVGYGFRFGLKYLVASVLVGILIISLLGVYSEYFIDNRFLTLGLLTGVVVVPTYAAFLLAKYQKVLYRLEESNQARNRFIANMSHELRTPLNSIILNVESLRENLSSDKPINFNFRPIEIISESSVYLKRLVNRVLEVSSIEAGLFSLGEPDNFDLFKVL